MEVLFLNLVNFCIYVFLCLGSGTLEEKEKILFLVTIPFLLIILSLVFITSGAVNLRSSARPRLYPQVRSIILSHVRSVCFNLLLINFYLLFCSLSQVIKELF